jgi:hypothetical protein
MNSPADKISRITAFTSLREVRILITPILVIFLIFQIFQSLTYAQEQWGVFTKWYNRDEQRQGKGTRKICFISELP